MEMRLKTTSRAGHRSGLDSTLMTATTLTRDVDDDQLDRDEAVICLPGRSEGGPYIKMSYYFTILSSTDSPLFSQAFGTSRGGGDGVPRFRFPDNARFMNQFIVHASLDIVEEVQWSSGAMYDLLFLAVIGSPLIRLKLTTTSCHRYLKHIDTYPPASAYISAFLTGTGARFLLLHQPLQLSSASAMPGTSRASSSSIANNPTSPQTEEAVRQFMNEVYENWVKTVMSPFYRRGMEIKSPVFRSKVLAAGKKWL